MELKVKSDLFFFFQKYAGEVTKATKRGENDQLFPPLEALWPSFFRVHTPLPETHHPAPNKASDLGDREVDRIFFFLII